jgi:hypothetical protein
MPAANKTKFQVLRSTTATSVPSPTILDVGELALNTADRKLYSKHSDGTVFQIGSQGVAEATWVESTSSFTATAGGKYLINTSSIADGSYFEITLPSSPSLGNIILFVDAIGNFHNRPIQIKRNGEVIMGLDEDMYVNARYAAFGLVYYDTTYGWRIHEL